ncbi:oligosaccharide flippase family protein [Arthrobacter sp. NicSoilB8]|uniref:oligosaccharide flippase family protein n=1 Tax=Arthrobacter sp. NicSoilB8 TaxID=2830998 RepID=UPI001CC72205|nr:oligosaccharide flippase family protein [Arthrobacter sp. NicSoilB8]BCW72565.1 peptide-binding protein [Arthrobacter sp. NicSoilB8]
MRRKFVRDGALLFSGEIVSKLLAFSVSFVLARQIGLEALALLALAQSIVAYATVVGDAGLGTDAVRRISNGESAEAVVTQTARVQVMFALLASLVVVPIAVSQTDSSVAIGVSLVPIFFAASATYVLSGRLDAKNLAVSRVLGNVVVCVAGMTSVFLGYPIGVIAFSYSAGAMASMLYVNYIAGVRIKDFIGPLPWRALKATKSKYLALASYTLIVHAYSSALIIMAQNFGGGSHLVEVALSTRVLLLLFIPAQLLGSLLLPRFSRGTVSMKIMAACIAAALIFGALMSTAVHLTARWFVPLMFGPDSQGSVASIEQISLQLPLFLASTVLIAYFLAAARYGLLARLYFLALLVQIAIGYLLRDSEAAVFVLSVVFSEWIFVMSLLVALLMSGSSPRPIKETVKIRRASILAGDPSRT